MGLLNKAKFWKKEDDDMADLSDLGDFGLEDHQAPAHGADFDAGPSHPASFGQHTDEMQGGPIEREEVQPTRASVEMGEQMGLKPAQPSQQHPGSPMSQQPYQPYQAPAQQEFRQGPDLNDIAKELEIVHAKLDAIKSSLDSMNQRLATLERIASPETKNRYAW